MKKKRFNEKMHKITISKPKLKKIWLSNKNKTTSNGFIKREKNYPKIINKTLYKSKKKKNKKKSKKKKKGKKDI